MSFLRAVLERLPGSHALKDGHGFALGSILAADLPACNHSRDGEKRRIPGAAGVADREVVCEKDAADAYAWQDKGAAAMTTANDSRYVNVAGDTMTGNLTISKTVPASILFETNAGTNEKHWDWTAFSGDLYLVARSDDLAASFTVLTLTRTGVTAVAASFGGSVAIGGGTPIVKVLSATATWNPISLVNGATDQFAPLTVTGAAVGDPCFVGLTSLTVGYMHLTAHVYQTDTVAAILTNHTGATQDIGSGTLRVTVFKH